MMATGEAVADALLGGVGKATPPHRKLQGDTLFIAVIDISRRGLLDRVQDAARTYLGRYHMLPDQCFVPESELEAEGTVVRVAVGNSYADIVVVSMKLLPSHSLYIGYTGGVCDRGGQ